MKSALRFDGEGTEENPYKIKSINDLLSLSYLPESENTEDKFYKMMNNIDASGTRDWFRGTGFPPIGKNVSCAFQGTFDGNKKKITDLYINRTKNSSTLCVGLFGCTDNATIKNLELKNVTIFGAIYTDEFYSAQAYVGGLVGQNDGTIINCKVFGNVTGEATSTSPYSNSNVTYAYIGVLAGYNNCGKIINCKASGVATGNRNPSDWFGGLVGYNPNYGSIDGSFWNKKYVNQHLHIESTK